LDIFYPIEKVASSMLIDYSAFSSESKSSQTAPEKPKPKEKTKSKTKSQRKED